MLVTPEAGGRIAGRYLLQEPIGRGGMGVVWRAWDERLERWVAVKCARLDDDRATQRLMGEAGNAGRLHHPNIVGVFDFVDEGATCWIVMEYVPSRSLAQILNERGPIAPEEAGSIGCQIADALTKSHGEGVVHGDVTPENILVTEEGVARLTDFGISRALWSDATQTATGSVRGKPRYLAPEVAKGQPAGEKADVFSLGASLFAAVEGRSPYGEAEHLMTYLARVDACKLLDATALERLPGVEAGNQDRGFGSWNCDWSSDDGEREVEIQFSRDNELADDGERVDVSGTTGYAIADEAEDDSCTVRTPHRTYTNSVGDHTIELFQLTVYAPQPTRQLCDSATEFAATVKRNIARQLPGLTAR
ncbi:serine/threonine-protein kinase [Streptomyces sp. NBC_00827]|uniref:serine/threonine-protein kinase n=1 Tax=Streptomyces sp. NBC_00827 TaxID=2903677 RepID=UPI00386A500D|nr:serine/threonine protein kinase [Streptomyces sp. NBC_00827]